MMRKVLADILKIWEKETGKREEGEDAGRVKDNHLAWEGDRNKSHSIFDALHLQWEVWSIFAGKKIQN